MSLGQVCAPSTVPLVSSGSTASSQVMVTTGWQAAKMCREVPAITWPYCLRPGHPACMIYCDVLSITIYYTWK